jgi:predicted ATPase
MVQESEGEHTTFARLVRDALRHLHDFVYLRTHPLTEFLREELGPPERGKRLHQLLLDGIAALYPRASPIDPRVSRRHELLTLRYVEALEIGEVTSRLGISRREYTRQHHLALDALVSLLQESEDLLDVPVAQAAAPNDASGSGPRDIFPLPLSSFIGRERESAEVLRLLGSVRLVTLTGAPGTGKTRLALYLAATLSASDRSEGTLFPNGIVFVPLASIADPNLVVSMIARAMGIGEVPGRTLLQALEDHVSRNGMLLILDNFEHVLPAAPTVSRLLAACPRLTILATSREALRLSGEHEFSVPPLQVPEDRGPIGVVDIAENEAVRLYVERARAKMAVFRLSDQNAAAVSALCRRLDGLPLAIELAAARSRVFSPHVLLQRLEGGNDRAVGAGSLALLSGGARDVSARQQTLRNAIDWSYRLLTGDEQELFSLASVFAGGWTLDAAEAICTVDGELDVLDAMSSLLDKSLVGLVESPNRGHRFTMLETIRQYAAERLHDGGREKDARDAHASYFVRMGQDANDSFNVSAHPAWLDRLEHEHDNMRVALSWLATIGDYDAALRLVAGLWWYWWIRGHISEGRHWLDRILAETQETNTVERAEALTGASHLAMMQGEFALAERYVEGAVALAQQVGDRMALGDSLMTLGLCALRQGDLQAAKRAYSESVTLAYDLGRSHRAAIATRALGALAQREGDVKRAMQLVGESVTIHHELNDIWELSTDYLCLGLLAQQMEDPGQAERFFHDSLRFAEQVWEVDKIAYLFDALAGIAVNAEKYAQAARLLAAAGFLWKTVETKSFRKSVEVAFPESDQEVRATCEIKVQEHLGDEWERTRQQVRSMTVRDVVTYGLRTFADR